MSFIIGSKRLNLEDLAKLSLSRTESVRLDESIADNNPLACERVEELPSTKQPKKFLELPHEVRRAAIIVKLHTVILGATPVRKLVLKVLVDLLNHDIIPQFSSFERAGEDLISFLRGFGSGTDLQGAVYEAFEVLNSTGNSAINLTKTEIDVFVDHPFLFLGYTSMIVFGAAQIMRAVDCVAALSAEAKGCSAEPFEMVESTRPHRGEITSASNLKNLLEGSKVTVKITAADSSDMVFHNIPQIHGPCWETVVSAVK